LSLRTLEKFKAASCNRFLKVQQRKTEKIAFAFSHQLIAPLNNPIGKWWEILYASCLLWTLVGVALIGARLFAKAGLVFLVNLTVAFALIIVSFFTSKPVSNPDTDLYFTGLNSTTLSQNIDANYSIDPQTGTITNFQAIFAVIFPACGGAGGIMASSNLSGDLKVRIRMCFFFSPDFLTIVGSCKDHCTRNIHRTAHHTYSLHHTVPVDRVLVLAANASEQFQFPSRRQHRAWHFHCWRVCWRAFVCAQRSHGRRSYSSSDSAVRLIFVLLTLPATSCFRSQA
jgi:hypothetical protein